MSILKSFFFTFIFLLISSISYASHTYTVGVYYFPGWRDNSGIRDGKPWNAIINFPDRYPLLGFYPEGEDYIAKIQLDWMKKFGIDLVIYDWYWINGAPFLEHAVSAYKHVSNGSVKFALLWANHRLDVPKNINDFKAIVSYWIRNFFLDPRYYCINGKPVVIIFDPGLLSKVSNKLGTSTEDLFDIANEAAKLHGISGIYFIGVTHAIADRVKNYLPKVGYSALTGYNYSFGLSGKLEYRPSSASYAKLIDGYEETWQWILNNTSLPYFVPVTSGWNKKPLGGSQERWYDNSISTPESFKSHLHRAKKIIDNFSEKTMRTIFVCCWNEFGEGSYIEPTKKYGFKYLEAIQDTFGTK